MKRWTVLAVSCVAYLAAQLAAGSAFAYRVYTTESQGPEPPAGCSLAQPQKLVWDSTRIEYRVETPPEQVVDPVAGEEAVHQSFGAWTAVAGCAQPKFADMGEASEGIARYNDGSDSYNENGVYWITKIQDWRHGADVLALTTLTYSTCTGQIVDADIEVNAAQFALTVTDNPTGSTVDVRNTMTHEVGHFLGLDHSLDAKATMYKQAPNGEVSKRTLTQDDVNGLCCLYQDGAPTVLPDAICEGAPSNVGDTDSGLSSGGDAGVGCESASGSAGWIPVAVAAAMLALGAIRRRERASIPARSQRNPRARPR